MNFKCPYCGRDTTITDPNYDNQWVKFDMTKSKYGSIGLIAECIACPNEECKELVLKVRLSRVSSYGSEGGEIKKWQLMPESSARVLPDYIPKAIQEDYYESCRIRDLSPKASATLSRRCLQGMIRDFHGITKDRLIDEIKALEGKIDTDVWQSIDAVRAVGNIGAHMEKDINVIIDVEPDEAQLLIGLIEQLVDDWYVTRHQRQTRAAALKKLAEEKK